MGWLDDIFGYGADFAEGGFNLDDFLPEMNLDMGSVASDMGQLDFSDLPDNLVDMMNSGDLTADLFGSADQFTPMFDDNLAEMLGAGINPGTGEFWDVPNVPGGPTGTSLSDRLRSEAGGGSAEDIGNAPFSGLTADPYSSIPFDWWKLAKDALGGLAAGTKGLGGGAGGGGLPGGEVSAEARRAPGGITGGGDVFGHGASMGGAGGILGGEAFGRSADRTGGFGLPGETFAAQARAAGGNPLMPGEIFAPGARPLSAAGGPDVPALMRTPSIDVPGVPTFGGINLPQVPGMTPIAMNAGPAAPLAQLAGQPPISGLQRLLAQRRG